jgi:hypothetical protein
MAFSLTSLVDGFTTEAILRFIERYNENENSDSERLRYNLTGKDGKSYSAIKEIVPRIKQTLYIVLSCILLFIFSSCTYCTFYCFYIPPNYVSVPIHFNYNKKIPTHCSNPEIIGNPINNNPERKFSVHNCKENELKKERKKLKLPPTAIIDLFAGHTQWQAIFPDVVPLPKAKSLDTEVSIMSQKARLLQPKQEYFFDVVLTLPESDTNRKLGMFTVEVELKANDERMLATVSRSSMLPYESSFLSFARQFFFIIPYLVGALSQARTVSLKCFDRFTESFEYPLRFIEIRLVAQSPANHLHSAASIQVINAELHIGKELNKLQTIMKEWFYISGMIAIIVLMIFNGLIYIFSYALFYSINKQSKTKNAENLKQSETAGLGTKQNQPYNSMERRGFYETYTYEVDDSGETDAEFDFDDKSTDEEQKKISQKIETGTLETPKMSITNVKSKRAVAMDMKKNMSQENTEVTEKIELVGRRDSNENEDKRLSGFGTLD